MKVKNIPLVLLILDGWGVSQHEAHNAIQAAQTPQWDAWWATEQHGLLDASGEAVGLPAGQIGNSEVGHMHLGAGRLLPQDLTRINNAIETHQWAAHPFFETRLKEAQSQHPLHIMGLCSEGGVHSHLNQLLGFLALCAEKGIKNIALHLFLDGRDTPPQSALRALEQVEAFLKLHPIGRIASLCGRYYAMDRDNRWERVKLAYDLLTLGKSEHRFKTAAEAIAFHYEKGCFDEFIPPTVIGEPLPMQAEDSAFFFNYRADRARQLTQALVLPDFSEFKRDTVISFKHFYTMTRYQKGLPVEVMFPPIAITHPLGEVLSAHGLKQLRIAETEKYAHVTFFLNGGRETPFDGESRTLVPSPKVATYDLQPEMSAHLLTQQLVKAIESQEYDVILCNYANADMVGHTGDMQAAMQAISCLDTCISKVGASVKAAGGVLLITADHGNAEVMFDEQTNQPHTAHTTHLVPFVFVGTGWEYRGGTGRLSDVAPTILKLLGLPKPPEMTGESLLTQSN